MILRCGGCRADLTLKSSATTHITVGEVSQGQVVCGITAHRAYILADPEELGRVAALLDRLEADVAHHRSMEGGDPEVRGVQGWFDLSDAVGDLRRALGLHTVAASVTHDDAATVEPRSTPEEMPGSGDGGRG